MRVKDVQVGCVILADPVEITPLTKTGVTFSNINELIHVMNKKNPPPDKERDKPPPPSQNPTNPQKSKTSVFIVGDSMIKSMDTFLQVL